MSNQDQIYLKALARFKELCAFEAERKELEAFLRTYEKIAGSSQPDVGKETALPVSPSPTAEIVDTTLSILAEHRRPLPLADIYDALLRRGLVIGGKVPRNNLGAKLSADTRLRTGPSGWWFASDPYPRRLDGYADEEGPDTELVTRPLHSNGAAVSAA